MNTMFANTKITFDTTLFDYASINEPLVAVPKSYLKNFNIGIHVKIKTNVLTKKRIAQSAKLALKEFELGKTKTLSQIKSELKK
jgi:hypothetical protein